MSTCALRFAGILAFASAMALVSATPTHAAAPSSAQTVAPLLPLPMLPSIARVKVEAGPGQLLVTEDVLLPRGEWKGEALDFYVAFGAPGTPRAVDAHLLPVGDGLLEAEEDAPSEALAFDRAPRRPKSAHPLLGRESMAGIVIHVRPEALVRAFASGNMAQLRVRTALDLPAGEGVEDRGTVIRLGASRGVPLTLGRIQVTTRKGGRPVTQAEARLCGPDADPHLLAVVGVPRSSDPQSPRIAPVLAVRHASDDLCLRLGTSAAPP